VSASDILNAADRFGLFGRGVRLEVEELHLLPKASILHWEFNHFVVFERIDGDRVHIVDPARGSRVVGADELTNSFTGIALLFDPSPSFAAPSAGKRPASKLFSGALRAQRGELCRIAIISLLLRCLASTTPLLIGVVVDKVVPRGDLHLLVVVGLGLGAMLVFEAVSSLVRAHLLLQVRTRVDTRLTLGFLEHMMALPYAFFQTRSAGDLLMRVHSTATVREVMTSNMLSSLLDGAFVAVYLIAIVLVSPLLALLVAGTAALNVGVFLATRGRSYQLMVADVESQTRSQSELIQLIDGIATLKCGGIEQRAVQRWSSFYVDELNAALRRGSLSAWVDSLRGLIETAAPLALLSIGALQVVRGDLSLGAMLATNALAAGIFGPISSLVSSALQLQLIRSHMERIDDVMAAETEQRQCQRAAPRALRGQLTAHRLTFRYGSSGPPVIDDLTLEIPPRAHIAIVGASGSGKSTLASLLVGLYEPQQGAVYFDGIALREFDLRSIRQQIGIVPQHAHIFGGTVRENIALTQPTASMGEIERAARLACIHDDIAAMPLGYESLLAPGGGNISGGQRQRIAIARALIRDASIIMLDEATSALDARTEGMVMANLRQLHSTRIVIAHRLSTIVDADLIVVLHRGRIVEFGRHPELVARGGTYRCLIELQGHPAPARPVELAR
jgi:ABC-type bacteriocin/lantibiotic exporter with double-glycine peptidase domain